MANLSTYFPQRPGYTPPMMQFDGASYYSKTGITTSGNKYSAVVRFAGVPGTGGTNNLIFRCDNASGYIRFDLIMFDTDHADSDIAGKLQFRSQNSAGSNVMVLVAPSGVGTDGAPHTAFIAYDADAGTAQFIVDGVDADDTGNANRIAPATATLPSGAGSYFLVGATVTPINHFVGQIGFLGYREAYLTNWQDFMGSQGNPKAMDEFRWTQWGGGTPELPYQVFDGSTGDFSKANTGSGNKVTIVARFKTSVTTGDKALTIAQNKGTSYQRMSVFYYTRDYTTSPNRQGTIQIVSTNSAGTNIMRLFSLPDVYDDGQWHTLLAAFDGDAGAATFVIDGAAIDDTGNADRIAPTTGTLPTDAGNMYFGSSSVNPFDGSLSFTGAKDAYLTNWGDFMDATGLPQELDELNWTEWGGQPEYWNKYGAMDDNKGSAGNMTRTATVTHTTNSQPLFWHEAAKMDEQLGSAGVMTENGTILLGKGGN